MGVVPVCFDLDGTLIRNDTSFDLCVEHVKKRWLIGCVQLLIWFLTDKSAAKATLAELYAEQYDVSILPYNFELIDSDLYQCAQRRVLVSGSDDRIVQKVAQHLGGFEFSIGAKPGANNIGEDKAKLLSEKFPEGFEYVGDSQADIAVWTASTRAHGVNVSERVCSCASQQNVALQIFSHKGSKLGSVLKAMRIHQWSKNGLLILTAGLSLAAFEPVWLLILICSFLAFGLVASATYLFNDMLDIPADRAHQTKRKRPLASGALSIVDGVKAIAFLAIAGLFLAALLDLAFLLVLVVYALISISYSAVLKRIMMLDVIVLSFLFCLRVFAGAVVLDMQTNSWLLISLGFFFSALALGKRFIELADKTENDAELAGRGYVPADCPVVLGAGLACSFASSIIVLIYALLSQSAAIQHDISAMAIVVILIFWLGRFWLLVGRKQVDDDPIVFALKDRVSLVTLGILGIVIVIEQLVSIGMGG